MGTQYKIRQLTTNNKCGDVMGITIPQSTAQQHIGVYFSIDNGETIKEYHEKIIDLINNKCRELTTEIKQDEYHIIKKFWTELRTEIIKIQNPYNNNILLVSGCKINR